MSYIGCMTREQIAAVLDQVRTWPEERQVFAAKLLMLLEAQTQSAIPVSEDEWNAIQEGNAQAERGEFVGDEEMAAPSSLPPLPTFDGGGELVNIADRNALYDAMEDDSELNWLHPLKK
jgi:hypothetical protein